MHNSTFDNVYVVDGNLALSSKGSYKASSCLQYQVYEGRPNRRAEALDNEQILGVYLAAFAFAALLTLGWLFM